MAKFGYEKPLLFENFLNGFPRCGDDKKNGGGPFFAVGFSSYSTKFLFFWFILKGSWILVTLLRPFSLVIIVLMQDGDSRDC